MHPTTAVATAFFAAMERKSLEEAPIAEDSSYESPLTPEPIAGREHLIRFIGAYLPAMKEVRVIRHIAGGDHVATIWQAGTVFGIGTISLVYVFRVEAGLIAAIQAFYDPRGFIEGFGS